MPYFKNNNINILLIHIPKTGGTSLEFYFSDKYNIELNSKSLYMLLDKEQINNNIVINSTLQHMTYETILKYKKEFNINFNNIKIITIVRNPYERLISDLFFQSIITINSTKEEVFNRIKSYLISDCDNHNIPQHVFITNDKKELMSNIHILRTETLSTDMHNLGYENFDEYCKANVNTHKVNSNLCKVNYYDFLNDDSIKIINDYYDYDFKLFNYKKISVN
jgi:hypothetical protein